MVTAVEVFWCVKPFLSLIIGWNIGNDGAGVESLVLECESIREGLEARASGAQAESSIDLAAVGAFEIRGAVEGKDFPGGILHDNNCTVLDIFLIQLRKFFGQNVAGLSLYLAVDAEPGAFIEAIT